jgi:hypothetical protein
MTGGVVIEVMELIARTKPHKRVNRLWCVDKQTHDEVCVHAEWYPPGSGPKVGESIWWQAGSIYYDRDRKQVRKVGQSYRPKGAEQ